MISSVVKEESSEQLSVILTLDHTVEEDQNSSVSGKNKTLHSLSIRSLFLMTCLSD